MRTLILVLIILGFTYRLLLTSDGNFIFNMDNARDFVDVREMVILQKIRLIGPTSAIEGVYNGPGWYYLLAIPFILSGGHPYYSILMMITLWAIGGYFLLKLISRWGVIAVISAGVLWIFSNYMTLATAYSFNPHSVTLLAPLFIFLLEKYLKTAKTFFAIATWFLAGLFFNFEMNFGIFLPIIVIVSLVISKKTNFLRRKHFWAGLAIYLLTLFPQIIFDVRHQFIMTNSMINYLFGGGMGFSFEPVRRVLETWQNFYNSFVPTFLNQKYLVWIILPSLVLVLAKKKITEDLLLKISLSFILVPFAGYVLLPVTVNSWHLGGVMAISILLTGFIVGKLWRADFKKKIIALVIVLLIFLGSLSNLMDFFKNKDKPSHDPSVFKNEIAAIDFVYQYADGDNFKVYTYLPSVIDYPYQYLFWWYGKKEYGYVPLDYAYSPDKPAYISNKEKFGEGSNLKDSGLVFLIKEPDRIGIRHLWENDFKGMNLVTQEKVVPLEIEVRERYTPF